MTQEDFQRLSPEKQERYLQAQLAAIAIHHLRRALAYQHSNGARNHLKQALAVVETIASVGAEPPPA